MRTLIFIPCLNDSESAEMIVNQIISEYNFDCFIVDDGSSKPIEFSNQSDKVFIFRFERNQGIGVSTALALNYCKMMGYDRLIRIDSDGEHKVSDIAKLIDIVAASKSDLVIGQRTNYIKKSTLLDYIKNIGREIINIVSQIVTRTEIYDWYSGFMLLDKRAIDELSGLRAGTYPEAEIYLESIKKDLKISTVDIKQNQRSSGKSTMSFKRGMIVFLRFCILMMSFIFRRGK